MQLHWRVHFLDTKTVISFDCQLRLRPKINQIEGKTESNELSETKILKSNKLTLKSGKKGC